MFWESKQYLAAQHAFVVLSPPAGQLGLNGYIKIMKGFGLWKK